jgi:hypothetical protein
VRFRAYELLALRAGTETIATVVIENAGAGTLQPHGAGHLQLSYHWLDPLGNPIVWDGLRTALDAPIAPGERRTAWLRIAVPTRPGPCRLVIDLLSETRYWLAELGNRPLELEVEVLPRLSRRSLSVQVEAGPPHLAELTDGALAAQEEPIANEGDVTAFLAAGCMPAPDWSRLILAAHDEGYAAVGGSIAVTGRRLPGRRGVGELGPWAPGFGRSPNWSLPLLCPSLVAELVETAPWTEPLCGLPALDATRLDQPWLCDGRIRISIPAARALPPSGRRRA